MCRALARRSRIMLAVLFSLCLPTVAVGEDYDVYDPYGRRTGSLRSRDSTVHVLDSPSPFESVGSLVDGIGRMRQLRTQKEILETQKELIEEQRELLREQREQKEVTKQVFTPAAPEVVNGIMAAFYDDVSYEQFLDSLIDDELRAFWVMNARAILHAQVGIEAAMGLSRADVKSSLMAMWGQDKAEARMRLSALPAETFTLLRLDKIDGADRESWEETRATWKKQIAEVLRKPAKK